MQHLEALPRPLQSVASPTGSVLGGCLGGKARGQSKKPSEINHLARILAEAVTAKITPDNSLKIHQKHIKSLKIKYLLKTKNNHNLSNDIKLTHTNACLIDGKIVGKFSYI
ncbi:hypothetical protein E9531_16825 [Lampropedia puyangensis]|uniref:Uncharacterized protein n=1 Tax=Lampropedia puyangensis TaxID=1330072 RepID=A0A4S8EN39_9BURK|nr:hypothetical protein [Lampropedia puyangensis]THT96072.1 hypothetical protein E9531_16825 [Lampropedia puyangensis]